MYDFPRLAAEVAIIGVTNLSLIEGVPRGGSGKKWDAILAAHVADEAAWLEKDLDVHAAAVYKVLSEEEWLAYLAVQTSCIRELRRQRYCDSDGCNAVFLEAVSDGETFTNAKAAAQAAKAQIKVDIPWPGEYR